MRIQQMKLFVAAQILSFAAISSSSYGVNLQFVGSQANLGGTFEPGGGLPYVTTPWRTSNSSNIYATGSGAYPDQFYGKDGYALFATTFTYPDADLICCDANIDPVEGDPLFPNVIDLPEWVADSQILATRMAGGYLYALLDDPVLMHDGTRQWTFDGTNYPLANGSNTTGQNPWVKMGLLDGNDLLGNNPASAPTGRWGFTVGPDTPSAFRVGVLSGGDRTNGNFSPEEIFLQQFDGITPVGDPVSTGLLSGIEDEPFKDKFVDMHFFDIVGAEEGDSFSFGVTSGANSFGNAGIVGFSFDVLPDVGIMNADFNDDGSVDGEDFLIWQRGFGTGTMLAQGDANDDGSVNGADLTIWQDQYGDAPLVAAVTVPEPTALVLLLAATFCGMARRRG